MNLVLATIDSANGDVWASFGPHRLRLEPSTLERHPGLAAYEGRQVVVGVRPEDMEDAAVLRETHPDRVISVFCDIREDMGSEVYVHFNVEADAVATREVVEALVVEAAEDEEARIAANRARGEGVTFVARLERASEARERQPLAVEVDVARLHFFDPETGVGVNETASQPAA
jgi:multiple sugar transport system ATP-binding protein